MKNILLLPTLTLVLLTGCSDNTSSDPAEARKELIELGVPISETSFNERVDEGDVVAVRLFLATEMDPDATMSGDNIGMTPLVRATYEGRTELARVLLEDGADPNVEGPDASRPKSCVTGVLPDLQFRQVQRSVEGPAHRREKLPR